MNTVVDSWVDDWRTRQGQKQTWVCMRELNARPGLPARHCALHAKLKKCSQVWNGKSPFSPIIMSSSGCLGAGSDVLLSPLSFAPLRELTFRMFSASLPFYRAFTPLKPPKINLIPWYLATTDFGWLLPTLYYPLFRFALISTFWILVLSKQCNRH